MHLEMILFLELMKMRVILLINSIFFDTDCISAFLWVNNESLLAKMYPRNIVIPKQVYDELSNPKISHLKKRIDALIENNIAIIQNIDIETEEYFLYRKLTTNPGENCKIIGKGEAASISLAKKYNGILGSNNLRDIKFYVEKFSLRHITTGDILVEAYEKKLITKKQANIIWENMLAKKRKLGANSFTQYLKNRKNDIE